MSTKKLRNLIREVIEETLSKDHSLFNLIEADSKDHSLDRLSKRFIDRVDLEVGYELNDSVGEYKVVGTYSLNQEERDEIKRKYRFIEKYKFDSKKSFGVKLAEIEIDPKRINYYSKDNMEDSLGKNLLFVDKKTNSNGNVVFAIIRDNSIVTIYFGKNYVPQTTKKMNVDFVIKNELFFLGIGGEKKGSRKVVELNLPLVTIKGEEWYIDEQNEEIIYKKNIKKKKSFNELSEEEYEDVIESI
jgi:hypothetical protein